MSEVSRLFFQKVLPGNIVLISFLGVLLIIVEAKGAKESLTKGLKYSFCLIFVSLFGWATHSWLAEDYRFFSLWLFLLISLLAIIILNHWGELIGEWQGFPKSILALSPMIGLQLVISQQGKDLFEAIIMTMGAACGFYIAFLLIGSIREQIDLSEAAPIFKGVPILLIAIGILTMGLLGFRFK